MNAQICLSLILICIIYCKVLRSKIPQCSTEYDDAMVCLSRGVVSQYFNHQGSIVMPGSKSSRDQWPSDQESTDQRSEPGARSFSPTGHHHHHTPTHNFGHMIYTFSDRIRSSTTFRDLYSTWGPTPPSITFLMLQVSLNFTF